MDTSGGWTDCAETYDELINQNEIEKRRAFDLAITRKLGMSMSPPPDTSDYVDGVFDSYEDENENESPQILEDNDNDWYDSIINAEVLLPRQGTQTHAVVPALLDKEGKVKGGIDDNPVLNKRIYDVTFSDGAIKQYAANVIAENMLAQVDHEGHQYLLLDHISDHRFDDTAIKKDDQYVVTKRVKRHLRQTTKGWSLCVLWKDGSQE